MDIANHVGLDNREWFVNRYTEPPNQTPELCGEEKVGSNVL
jgi:hypothetical protein